MSSGGLVLVALVALVTVMGFIAGRWGHRSLTSLDEWALGGRRFGTLVSWFLLGGDLYTAYTFIAVPALVYGVGALGFFAVPYATDRLSGRPRRDDALLGRRAQARLRDDRRLHPRSLRRPEPRSRRRAHRRRCRNAVHRAAARRDEGRVRATRRRLQRGRRAARDYDRVRPARGIHVHQRSTRAGAHRVRQGHADLRDRHCRDRRHSGAARRLGAHLLRFVGRAGTSRAAGLDPAGAAAVLCVCDDGAGIVTLALHLPAFGDERALRAKQSRGSAQRRTIAHLLTPARLARASGLLRDGRGHRYEGHDRGRAAALCPLLPGLVCRRRRRRYRHRRARPGRDHVHRCRESLCQQRLPRVLAAAAGDRNRRRQDPHARHMRCSRCSSSSSFPFRTPSTFSCWAARSCSRYFRRSFSDSGRAGSIPRRCSQDGFAV